MYKNTSCSIMIVVALLLSLFATARQGDLADNQPLQYPARLLHTVNSKADYLQHQLQKRMDKALARAGQQEHRLQQRLLKKDPALAARLFEGSRENITALQQQVRSPLFNNQQSAYNAYLDTLTTGLRFLQKGNGVVNNLQLQQSIGKLTAVQQQFTQAATVKQYLANRAAYLKQQLAGVGMVHQLQQYNKDLYYYSAQVNEYQSMLHHPDVWERKAIALLSQTKGFASFFATYSIIGSLFSAPAVSGGGASTLPADPALQTTQQVYSAIQQTAVTGGQSLQGLQSAIQAAQGQVQALTNKALQAGSSTDNEPPDFKPNSQKTHSFWKRLEAGVNCQSTKGNYWLPVATQFGASLGYKITDGLVTGIGLAGSAHWGKDIRHLSLTYQGLSVRNYLDIKLKRSFWLSGGFEMNYLPAIHKIETLKTMNAWKQSGLIGISKKYKAGKKWQGKVSLLWDYLSYSQIPRTQPLLFRFGYTMTK